jgi:hypothetical protein
MILILRGIEFHFRPVSKLGMQSKDGISINLGKHTENDAFKVKNVSFNLKKI